MRFATILPQMHLTPSTGDAHNIIILTATLDYKEGSMGKHKLYFKKPELESPPPGEWNHWLPVKIQKNLKIITPVLSILAVVVIVLSFVFLNTNAELTAWLSPLVGGIGNTFLRISLSVLIAIPAIIIMLLAHEILHLVPMIGKGDIYIYRNAELNGISPFADCEMGFWRSVIYKLLPVIIMSGGFWLVGLWLEGYIGSFLNFIAIINLGGSTGDLFFTPFMFRLPRNAVFYDDWWQVRR
jgi:hypothetical protein